MLIFTHHVWAIEGQIANFNLAGKLAAIERQIAALDVTGKVARLEREIADLGMNVRGRELERRRDDEVKRLEAAITALR